MKPRHRFCSVLLLLAACGFVHAQTPSIVIVVKLFDYTQTSATDQAIGTPSYLVSVTFPTAVPANTTVQLVGPVSLAIPRVSGTSYEWGRGYTTEAALELSLPDGNYTLAVSGGGTASSTPVTILSRPRFQPVLITNYNELQALTSSTFRINWQPVVGGAITDSIDIAGRRGNTNIFSSPTLGQPGALNGRSATYGLTNIDIEPGETLSSFLVFTRYAFSTANGGATAVAVSNGFSVNFSIRRLALIAPTIVSQPQTVTVAAGSTAALNVEATGAGLSYQWRKDGTNLSGATTPALLLGNVQTANAGIYSVVVSNPAGSASSANAALGVIPAAGPPARIVNLAIRTTSGSGNQTLIAGFVVGGAGTLGAKPLLVRAVGPALTGFGVPGVLLDPRLEIFSSTARVAENDNWGGDAQVMSITSNVGAFALSPATSRDAALYVPNLSSAAYTAQISGVGGASGIVLAEVYDATPAASFDATTPRLINVSARSTVGTGGDLLIAGFVIAGPAARTVLIRAVGPSLANFGVAGALSDPQLSLFSGSGRLLGNDDWGGNAALAGGFTGVGAFSLPAASRDAAVIVTLPPGSYTAQVSGANNTTGVALVEVYEVL